MYNEAINAIKNSHTIAIFMHINPDGDSISLTIALYTFLKNAVKEVYCFSDILPIPQKFLFLKNSDKFNNLHPEKFDLSIALDCGDAKRLGDECYKLFLKGKMKLVVDHHESHESFANITICEYTAASTTQILYKVLNTYNPSFIDKDTAMALYTGLITDSGSFSYNSTSTETHEVAAELLKYNIDVAHIYRIVQKNKSKEVFDLTNRVMPNAKFYENNQIAVIIFKKEDFDLTKTTDSNTEGLINNILDIDTVELAISIAEINQKSYKVSFRTKGKVNAAKIAKTFGGGGHSGAAGCRVYGYFEDIYNRILSVSLEMLRYA